MPEASNQDPSAAFQKLLETWTQEERRVATREAQARKEAGREIVEAASAYTVERLVKDLAEVQLRFGRSVETLSDTLAEETARLDQIRQATEIETRRIAELHRTHPILGLGRQHR